MARSTGSFDDRAAKATFLIEEYKLHKEEALRHLDVLYKQSAFIQLYGLVLLSLVAVSYGGATKPVELITLPTPLRVFSLLGAAVFLFYLTSTVATASYSIVIGRRRMAQIEGQINKIAGEEIFTYETALSGRFHENFALVDGSLTPFAWTASWRIVLFCGASVCLGFLGFRVMPEGYAIIYAASVVYFGLKQLSSYLFIFTEYGNKVITDTLVSQSAPRPRVFQHIVSNLRNWLIFVIFCLIVFGDIWRFTDPISAFVARAVPDVGAYSPWQVFCAILIYSILCALGALPAPSEATLLLIPHVGLVTVYAASALGRGLGSLALATLVNYCLRRSGSSLTRFLIFPTRLQSIWSNRKLAWPLAEILYFACQAIPWGPAKSSTMIYTSYAGQSRRALASIFILSGVGMIFRMYLVSVLISGHAAAMAK